MKVAKRKIKRYSDRINQYPQNMTFWNNQSKFYQDVYRGGTHELYARFRSSKGILGRNFGKEFWDGFLGVVKVHSDSAERFEQFKNEMRRQRVEEGAVNMTKNNLQQILRKIPN